MLLMLNCFVCVCVPCLLARSVSALHSLIGQATMAKQGSTLQNYNNELVKCTLQQLHQTNGEVYMLHYSKVY